MDAYDSGSLMFPGLRRRQPVPSSVTRIVLPTRVLAETDVVMRRFGVENRECYVWWGGYFLADGVAHIVSAVYPEVVTHYGRIHLRRRELSALHARLRTLDLVLVTELHTHPPGAGGQNDIDAANAAANYRGFTSIVVPDFAFPRFRDPREAYVYRYEQGGEWTELTHQEIGQLFVVAADPYPYSEDPVVAVNP